MGKVACIFGSTGLIGNYVKELLLRDKRYDQIIVFNRKAQNIQHSRITEIVGDYASLSSFKDQLKADEYYCCLGTTMKKAKTKAAFEYVDLQLPIEIANLAEQNHVRYFLVVSSLGASINSKNFYLKTKGKMEEAVLKRKLENVFIFRPSLLLGNRKEVRFLEIVSKPFLMLLGLFLIGPLAKYRAIHGQKVARSMIFCANYLNGKEIIESDQIKKLLTKSQKDS